MALFERYQKQYPELADELELHASARELPDGWDKDLPAFPADAKGIGHPRRPRGRCSTRSRRTMPWLIGGAADLSALDQDTAHHRGRAATSTRTTPAGGTSTSASASTRWAPS